MMVIFFVQYGVRSVPAGGIGGGGDDAREAKGDDGDDNDEPSETETDVARARPKAFARTVCEKSQDRRGDEPEEEDGARARLERATRRGGGSRLDVRGRIGDREADGGGHDARRRVRTGGVARGGVVRGLELTRGFRRLTTKIADDGTESGDDANLYLIVECGLPGVFRRVRDLCVPKDVGDRARSADQTHGVRGGAARRVRR